MEKAHLGPEVKASTPTYRPFYQEEMAELKQEILAQVQTPLPWGSLYDVEDMIRLEAEGDMPIETGFSVAKDGSIAVAVKTPMPQTTPEMWDWWFGWHGSESARYKLWHPQAHISARWEDGRSDHCYVGRTSIIKEYIGENVLDAAIQFQSPLDFGFSPAAINHPEEVVYICAKIGHPKLPVDYGFLVHQVRQTPNGTEMRSRFWLNGRYVSARHDNFVHKSAVKLLQNVKSLPKNFGQDLLLHCAEEMSHLATILPELYQAFAHDTEVAISGTTTRKGDPQFEETVMATLFNKTPSHRDPLSSTNLKR